MSNQDTTIRAEDFQLPGRPELLRGVVDGGYDHTVGTPYLQAIAARRCPSRKAIVTWQNIRMDEQGFVRGDPVVKEDR